jgi:hypothetical protein
MSSFIPFDTPAGVVWIQVEDSADDTALVNAFGSAAFDSFEDAAAALTSNAQLIRDMLVNLQPTGVEIRFGITAGVNPDTAGINEKRIFALAQSAASANYWVKVKWEEQDAG